MKWTVNRILVLIISLGILGAGIIQAVSRYRNEDSLPVFDKTNYTIGVLSADNHTMPNYHAIVDIALEDINQYLSENDIKCNISFDVKSTQRDPQTNLMTIRDWDLSGVRLFIGPPFSFMMATTMSYAHDNDVVVLESISTFPNFALDDNSFRLSVPYDKEGEILAEILNQRGYDTAICIESEDFVTWTADEFERNFNGETNRVKYDPDDVNSTVHLSKADELIGIYSDNHVAVVFFSYRNLSHLINQSTKYNRLSSVSWLTQNQGSSLEGILEKVGSTGDQLNITTYNLDIPESDTYQRIKSQYQKMTDEELDLKMLYVYDSCWLYTHAILETGTDNATIIKTALPLVASEYGGVCGVIEFDKYGDRDKAQYMVYTLFTENGKVFTKENEKITIKLKEITRESADQWKKSR